MINADDASVGNLRRDGHVWEAGAAAAARPGANLQRVLSPPPQEGLITSDLLQHHDQELEHHDGEVAAETERAGNPQKLSIRVKKVDPYALHNHTAGSHQTL